MTTHDPKPPPWAAAIMRQAAQIREAIAAAMPPELERQRRAAEQMVRAATAEYEKIVKPAIGGALKIHEAWRAALPPNWRRLDGVDLSSTLELIEQSGLCLVWVPRQDVIVELLASENIEMQLDLLEANREPILDDLQAVLDEVGTSKVGIYDGALELAAEAVAAANDNHFAPAQTAAAAGITEILHGTFGFPEIGGLGQARCQFEATDLDQTGLRMLRMSLIQVCTGRALVRTKHARPGFNRHGTQHGDRAFFSTPNSLAGMMLLVAWVRELAWFEHHHPEVFSKPSG